MTALLLSGPRKWGPLTQDKEGHRTLKITYLVKTTSVNDGPRVVMDTPGLGVIGSVYAVGNDLDPWMFLMPERTISIHSEKEGDPARFWAVELNYSTRIESRRCQDEQIEDPLLEPDRISGSFIKFTKEVMRDKDGNAIRTSSHEIIRGPQVEFDDNRPTVTIEQNVASLGLETFSQMIDTLNDGPMWGLAARRVKLSNVSWSRKIYGTCNYYYTRSFEFEVNYNGWDKEALDEGTKVLHGHWEDTGTGTSGGSNWVLDNIDGSPPDKDNPQHFDRYKDRNGENTRVILNGQGEPLADGQNPVFIDIAYYSESNFFSLGIPTTL